jgi:thiosulfate/3-mercaptopyruvate sulfurtransferase
MRRLGIFALAFLLAAAASAQPLLREPSLVTTEWLANHIDNPNLRIIDARSSLRDYLQGHIPNAIYLNTETLRISQSGVPARLLPPERLAEIFGAIGIGNQHTVVVYSSGDDAFAHATYIAFVLEWLGHRHVGILDGGFEKWRSEGRPISREFPKVKPAQFVPKVNPNVKVDWLAVWHAVQKRNAQVLDARDPKVLLIRSHPFSPQRFPEGELAGRESPDLAKQGRFVGAI